MACARCAEREHHVRHSKPQVSLALSEKSASVDIIPWTVVQIQHLVRQDIAELLAPRNVSGWRLNPREWHRYQDAMRDAAFCIAPSGCASCPLHL